MSEWKEVIASDFCTEVTDGTHDSPKPVSVGKYLLTSKHLQEYCLDFANAYMISEEDYDKAISRSKVEQYDILFSMIGTIGTTHRVKISNVDFAVKNMGIFKLGGNCLKSKWLYYWLKTRESKEYINSCLSGTTQGYMTLKALRNFPIAVPDSLTMESITSILSSLDDKIAVNKKICENLEAQAQALFKHWFVDFAPFKDGKFVESELGLIPEGWRVGKLGDICVTNKRTYGSSFSGIIEYIDTGSVTNNVIDNIQILDPKIDKIPSRARRAITEGDILYSSVRPNQRHFAFMYNPNSRMVASTGFVVITANWTGYRYFIYQYLIQDTVINSLQAIAEQSVSTYPSINASDIINIKIVIPPDDIVGDYAALSCRFMAEMEKNQKESRCLSTLRDTLLPKLMSGQIKVGDE